MTMPKQDTDAFPALQGLEAGDSSVRLRAALALGTSPDPRFIDKLIERCAIEPTGIHRKQRREHVPTVTAVTARWQAQRRPLFPVIEVAPRQGAPRFIDKMPATA